MLITNCYTRNPAQRKASLLVEYKALKKVNAFVDRRFGEQDDSLSAEDKALLRYQKQRTRELSRTSALAVYIVEKVQTACTQVLGDLQLLTRAKTWH